MTFGFNSAERVEGKTRGDSSATRRPGDVKLIEFIVLGYRESERGIVWPRRTHLRQRFCQTLGETLDRSQLPGLIRENFGMRVLPSIEPQSCQSVDFRGSRCSRWPFSVDTHGVTYPDKRGLGCRAPGPPLP